MNYFAHSGTTSPDGPDSDWQLLADHLRNVAALAEQFAKEASPNNLALTAAARAAGLLHDLGKYQLGWQQYLRESAAKLSDAKSIPHAIHGAAYAYSAFGHPSICVSVAGHHTGLDDWGTIDNAMQVGKKAPTSVVDSLMAAARAEIPELPSEVLLPDCGEDENAERVFEMWTRMLFSMLIDADRLDTERHSTGHCRPSVPLEPGKLLRTLTEGQPAPKLGTAERLNELRGQVYHECVAAGESRPPGFFELTVPTGGGKTRSAMASP